MSKLTAMQTVLVHDMGTWMNVLRIKYVSAVTHGMLKIWKWSGKIMKSVF